MCQALPTVVQRLVAMLQAEKERIEENSSEGIPCPNSSTAN
jgi:hypothetical protein